ncbi:MAG: peptidylprolyl isomerase [Anaerolineales bacterium]|nr:peptidylprolyl isomerase [Anaerolineales bacterium]
MSNQVVIQTEIGDLIVAIDAARAPITAANFLRYVDEGRYRDATFYRVVRMDNQPNDAVKIEVIQGGLGMETHAQRLPPIAHETTQVTGLVHTDGTVSMARRAPGSASSEFFICIGDQPELDFGGKRNPDGQGFAAFGRVVSGMDVVRTIQQLPADGQMLNQKINILSVSRIEMQNSDSFQRMARREGQCGVQV